MKWFKRKAEPKAEPKGIFSTHPLGEKVPAQLMPEFHQPIGAPGVASDNGFIGNQRGPKSVDYVNGAQLGFYAAGAYPIGYQACALLATNWLIDKACAVPARDAIRQGYLGIPEELRETDEKYKVNSHLRELIHFGRIYGGRIVMFDVDCENPKEFYELPFNIDGVKPGTYKGLSQIDPNWITPELTESNLSDPCGQHFYEPTYWVVNGRRIHRSHLYIFVPHPVPDFLKPSFNYLGMSVPQRIMERVYAAERSANEGPQLLMTKRMIVAKMAESAFGNMAKLKVKLQEWSELMNNFGIRAIGTQEDVMQFDTALGDVDTVIMTQYQLVASAANVPATKLFGVQPKGFNSTGEYEEASYREELESIQTNDLTPLLMRHYELVAKSLGVAFTGAVQWEALDSPTRKEFAEIEKLEAERDSVLFNTGAIDGEDIRNRVRKDKDGSYFGIVEGSYEDPNGQAGEVGSGTPGGAVLRSPAGLPLLSGREIP